MPISSLDWYIAKDIVRDTKEVRGRDAKPIHYIIAALMTERELHPDQEDVDVNLVKMVAEAHTFVPKQDPVEKIVKDLGF